MWSTKAFSLYKLCRSYVADVCRGRYAWVDSKIEGACMNENIVDTRDWTRSRPFIIEDLVGSRT